jgi:hypothetical protein
LIVGGLFVAGIGSASSLNSASDEEVSALFAGGLFVFALLILLLIPAMLLVQGLLVRALTGPFTSQVWQISYWKAVAVALAMAGGSFVGGIVDAIFMGFSLGLFSIAGSIAAGAWALRSMARRVLP